MPDHNWHKWWSEYGSLYYGACNNQDGELYKGDNPIFPVAHGPKCRGHRDFSKPVIGTSTWLRAPAYKTDLDVEVDPKYL
jgi:hypothetical protein